MTGNYPEDNNESCECWHCQNLCTEDDCCNPDDTDKVYVCDTCCTRFYQEYLEAIQVEYAKDET